MVLPTNRLLWVQRMSHGSSLANTDDRSLHPANTTSTARWWMPPLSMRFELAELESDRCENK
ncbi:hypothetical protein [Novipirellula sp.]|uniref:hypothetical protein n=1 Tax=Novipirellula sp. TaxID=2795430 RepID=UPI0035644004